jgi:hypothetical protein
MTVYRCGGVKPHQIKETVDRILKDFPDGVVIDGHLPAVNAYQEPIAFMYFLGFDVLSYFEKPGLMTGPSGVITYHKLIEPIKSAYSAKYLEYLDNHCRIYSAFTNWGELE